MKNPSKTILEQLLILSRRLPVKGCAQNLIASLQGSATRAGDSTIRNDEAASHHVALPSSGDRLSTDRIGAFSDAVIAVVITIMVLELKAPMNSGLHALWPLWPTAVSYVVSYLAVAIVWVNHHHLLRFVRDLTPRLVWVNFAHLFAVSLVPFSTAWIARTHLAAIPVAFYASVFVCVNVAFRLFEGDVFAQADEARIGALAKRMARRRSLGTILLFVAAALVALWRPPLGFALVCLTLVLYLRPEAPGAVFRASRPG
jgi:uncharacterized membrane protein